MRVSSEARRSSVDRHCIISTAIRKSIDIIAGPIELDATKFDEA